MIEATFKYTRRWGSPPHYPTQETVHTFKSFFRHATDAVLLATRRGFEITSIRELDKEVLRENAGELLLALEGLVDEMNSISADRYDTEELSAALDKADSVIKKVRPA